MSSLTLLLVISAHSVFGLESLVPGQKNADGSPSFNYYSPKAKEKAEQLTKKLLDGDDAVNEFLTQLVKDNKATNALQKYKNTAQSVEGTNCAVSRGDEDHFIRAQVNINTTIKTCVAFIPVEDREALKKASYEALVQVQKSDIALQDISIACFSLRVPESQSCKDSKEKELDKIDKVLSNGEEEKFSDLLKKYRDNAESYIGSCVDNSTKDLRDNLEAWTNSLEDCKSSL